MDWIRLAIDLAKIIGFTFLIVLPLVAYSTYAERRVCAIMQDRVGPNRVGLPLTLFGGKKDLSFFGLFQPLADGLKGLFKEDLTPAHVRKSFYWMAPALTAVPAFITLCVIPFGSEVTLFEREIKLVIADIGVGPLFIFAIASLSVYGITLAGWSSNSKYPFFGGVRSCAQMISYEIALGLSIIPVLMVFGMLNLTDIVEYQSVHGWLLLPFWDTAANDEKIALGTKLLLLIPLGISFFIFTVSIFAETNRMPFDLPECETELVGGYHTEYSSMKFALFFMGEYAAMIVGSAFIVTVFLGGWSLGFGLDKALLWDAAAGDSGDWKWFAGFIHLGAFLAKTVAFILFFIWVRWTVPRFRYDQLMKLGWVVFFELALLNIFIAALVIAAPHLGFVKTAFVGLPILLVIAALMFFITKSAEGTRQIRVT